MFVSKLYVKLQMSPFEIVKVVLWVFQVQIVNESS